MSERKVLNKYYPPDFDPSKVPRRRLGPDRQQSVRLVAPFSMRCNRCGEYIYRGKKFNARKETVKGEDYYGIKIFRFYIKCTRCSSEITFKTDPKNTDYAAEHGASRNFEPWRDPDADREKDILELDEERADEELDPMKALEQRTLDSQREMEILDALEDIRTRNARMERVDSDTVLHSVATGKRKLHDTPDELQQRQADAEDEELVRKYFKKVPAGAESDGGEGEGRTADVHASDAAPENGAGAPNATRSDAPQGQDADAADAPTRTLRTAHAPPADAASLLGERAREQLKSIVRAPSGGARGGSASKRRRAPNALGIVRK
ncbi:Pre-mRNA-splicing factor cwf16 [Malassezia sp. CBS 17886]|nr:Pre-mRNA-splicing factor cwf16 [Malassezia sp. CBS 17886]